MPDSLRDLSRAAGVLVAAWTGIMAAVLGVGWLLTGPLEGAVDPWDDSVARWFADHRTDTLGVVADAGTLLGDTPVGMGVAAVAAVAVAAWRRSWRPVLFMALAAAGIGAFYSLATHLVTRERPPVRILDPGLVPDHSFPSGHVATATVAYAGAFVLLWVFAPAARRWAWPLLLLPLLEVFARLYEGAHHVTDTLTSLAYAATWLAVLTRLVPGTGPDGSARHETRGGRQSVG